MASDSMVCYRTRSEAIHERASRTAGENQGRACERGNEMKPLCIDLFCGLGGWSEGFLAEGYWCVGFDIERHDYGSGGYPGDLVLQDILTLHGSQFMDAAVIVASPPCQQYSYMAMPWSRGKQIASEYRSGVRDVRKLTALFDACFRIQREACEAAGRYIPLIVENVRGAQPWVGRSIWTYGSFHLWGDVPALMPFAHQGVKNPGMDWSKFGEPGYVAVGFNMESERRLKDGQKVPGMNFHDFEKTGKPGRSFQSAAVASMPAWQKEFGLPGEADPNGPVAREHRQKQYDKTDKMALNQREHDGAKGLVIGGGTHHLRGKDDPAKHWSGSNARKAASAQIAKIPLALSTHIARVYKPEMNGWIREGSEG